MDRLIRKLIRFYRRLPWQPFKNALKSLLKKFERSQANRIVTATVDNVTMELDLGEGIDSKIYYHGDYERFSLKWVREYVRSGMVCFDIGANIGYYTLHLSRIVGNNGRVFAFEPTTWAFQKLQRNLSLNNSDNITVERLGLSDSKEFGKNLEGFAFQASWPIDKNLQGNLARSDTANFTTLDSYIIENMIESLGFIKVDVDGYEERVLKGGKSTINRFRPFILMEVCPHALDLTGATVKGLLKHLEKLDYTFIFVEDPKKILKIDEIETLAILRKSVNLACLPY
ncbi:MAG: FkbM family methyltransferase [bacterium]